MSFDFVRKGTPEAMAAAAKAAGHDLETNSFQLARCIWAEVNQPLPDGNGSAPDYRLVTGDAADRRLAIMRDYAQWWRRNHRFSVLNERSLTEVIEHLRTVWAAGHYLDTHNWVDAIVDLRTQEVAESA